MAISSADLQTPAGSIDEPADGSTLPFAPFRMAGWALGSSLDVVAVETMVNGRLVGKARLGVERPDIARTTDLPLAPLCGFERFLNPRLLGLAPGPIRIGAEAVLADGWRLPLTEVTVQLVERPAAVDPLPAPVAEAPRTSRRGAPRLLVLTSWLGRTRDLFLILGELVSKLGYSVGVLALEEGPMRGKFEEMGIEVRSIPPFPLDHIDSHERAVADVVAWASGQGFDAVVSGDMDCFPAGEIARRLGVPSILRVIGSHLPETYYAASRHRPLEDPAIEQRLWAAFRDAERVLFSTEFARRRYVEHRYVEEDRSETILLTIDLASIESWKRVDRSETRKQLGIPDDVRLVLHLGGAMPLKGTGTLAQAFARIAATHPKARLVMVGDRGDQFARGVHDYIRRMGLETRIELRSAVKAFAWLRAADVLVIASDSEGGPTVVYEAMAFGLPIVATDVADVATIVPDVGVGEVCRSRDVLDLARALDAILDRSPEALRAMGEAGRGFAPRFNDAGEQAKRWDAVIKEAVSSRSRKPSPTR